MVSFLWPLRSLWWVYIVTGGNVFYNRPFLTVHAGEPDPELKISCRQISPFIPQNYKESSYPTCVFSYVVSSLCTLHQLICLCFDRILMLRSALTLVLKHL